MTAVRYWPDGAPAVARCICGGDLMLVEDAGPKVPVECQCARCGDLTGVSHELVKAGAAPLGSDFSASHEATKKEHPPRGVVPGSPEDFGF